MKHLYTSRRKFEKGLLQYRKPCSNPLVKRVGVRLHGTNVIELSRPRLFDVYNPVDGESRLSIYLHSRLEPVAATSSKPVTWVAKVFSIQRGAIRAEDTVPDDKTFESPQELIAYYREQVESLKLETALHKLSSTFQ